MGHAIAAWVSDHTAPVPSVMVDGVRCYAFLKPAEITPEEDQIAGRITLVTEGNLPAKNDQSNFGIYLDQPHAFVEVQLLLFYDGTCYICTCADGAGRRNG